MIIFNLKGMGKIFEDLLGSRFSQYSKISLDGA
jgi:hypothetical protein